jgi:hypothetical protein
MQYLDLCLCYLRMSWVLAKSQGPCFPKKQIRIVTLNYSDTVIDGGNTKRENVWQSTIFARIERQYSKRNCRFLKIRALSHIEIYFHIVQAYLEAGGLYFQACVKSGTVSLRGLRLEAGFICGKAAKTAAVLKADSGDRPCINSQWFISYT